MLAGLSFVFLILGEQGDDRHAFPPLTAANVCSTTDFNKVEAHLCIFFFSRFDFNLDLDVSFGILSHAGDNTFLSFFSSLFAAVL